MGHMSDTRLVASPLQSQGTSSLGMYDAEQNVKTDFRDFIINSPFP